MSLKILISFCFLWMMGVRVEAQEIKLKDLSKIEFISSSPFWIGGSLHVVEVLSEGNVWNSYQLAHYSEHPKSIRDSIRHFIKAVPVKDLKKLLYYINTHDTVLNFEQFGVSAQQLKSGVDTIQKSARLHLKIFDKKADSIRANLTSEQKVYFFKAITSKQAINDAVLKAFHPLFNDDRSYFGIVFTFKNKHTDTISAYVNDSHLYHLPWTVHKKNNYNPQLSELFESLSDNNQFAGKERDRLVYSIDYELVNRFVLTKIFWDQYKNRYPANYNTLSKTLVSAYAYDNESGFLRSLRLPFNIHIRFNLLPGDTLNTKSLDASEEKLIKCYAKGNFFFDFLKAHPTYIGVVYGSVVEKTVDQIKEFYPEITKYNAHDIQFISTAVNFYQGWDLSKTAGWLLLPDNKMILLFCSDAMIQDGNKIFSGLTPSGKEKVHYYCSVFDRYGHKIAGGESPVKIETR